MLDAGSNAAAAEFVRRKIRAVVQNPETAMLLTPTQSIGCKRLCLDTAWRAFSFDPAELEKLITPKTKLLILNTPHNPTGGILARKDLEAIAAIAASCTWSGAGKSGCPMQKLMMSLPWRASALTSARTTKAFSVPRDCARWLRAGMIASVRIE